MFIPVPQVGIWALETLHRFPFFTAIHQGSDLIEAALQPKVKPAVHVGLPVTTNTIQQWQSQTLTAVSQCPTLIDAALQPHDTKAKVVVHRSLPLTMKQWQSQTQTQALALATQG